MRSKVLQKQMKNIFKSNEWTQEIHEFLSLAKNDKNLQKFSSVIEKLMKLDSFLNLVDETYFKFENELNKTKSTARLSSLPISTKNEAESNSPSLELDSLLNTLDDGYLIIGRDGANIELASSMAKKILGKDPTGDHLVNIITIPQESKDSFQDWLNMVFMEAIPFKELARLAPKGFQFGTIDKLIDVKFKPIRNSTDGTLNKIAMILHDNSVLFETEKIIGEQKLFTDMVIKYLNDKSNFIRLIQATRETADTLNSWAFNSTADIQEQARILSDRLHHLKIELNHLSMYSLGYKIHQIEDEIVTFFKVNPSSQEGENLVHLLGQEIYESLNSFLNKYRHIFIFDNKLFQTKEISVESIYRFCAELLRMGLTDLLNYYIDEIVAVPFASLFASIEARIYSQSLIQDSIIDYSLNDPKKLRVIPEFYSYFFEQLIPIFNYIVNHKNVDGLSNCKIHITLGLMGDEKNQKILVSINYSINSKSSDSPQDGEKEEALLTSLSQSVSHIGGSLEVEPKTENSAIINIQLPFVSEINSDVMNWINNGGPEASTPLRVAN